MKLIATLILSLIPILAFSQHTTQIIYDGNGNIIGGSFIKTVPPNVVTLKDSTLNYTVVLDSSHIYVTAYDSNGKVAWKTDPWKDNGIPVYRTRRPIIVDIIFSPGIFGNSKETEKAIWINYSNTQYGYLSLKTGEYVFVGQL